MRIGIFADSHDHLHNLRRAVELFNRSECQLVLFAGDLVSTFAVPPLRRLQCPLVGCYGDNEGNKLGLEAGMSILGQLREPPVTFSTADGTRFRLAHMRRQLRDLPGDFDVAVFGHTHKPRLERDRLGRWWLNPGETGGWTFGRPTVILLETDGMHPQIVELDQPLP